MNCVNKTISIDENLNCLLSTSSIEKNYDVIVNYGDGTPNEILSVNGTNDFYYGLKVPNTTSGFSLTSSNKSYLLLNAEFQNNASLTGFEFYAKAHCTLKLNVS